jgi:hypothetical protein
VPGMAVAHSRHPASGGCPVPGTGRQLRARDCTAPGEVDPAVVVPFPDHAVELGTG